MIIPQRGERTNGHPAERREDGWSSSREERGRMIIPQREERTDDHPSERREDEWSSSREERGRMVIQQRRENGWSSLRDENKI